MTPRTATGVSFDSLIAPLDIETFVADYWERKPVFIKGTPGKVDGLFGTDDLRRAVSRQAETGLLVRASFDRKGGPSGVGRHITIGADEAADYWDRGASLCVDPVDAADETLAALAHSARTRLGHLGGVSVKCYMSPDGAGFNPHFDAHVTTAIQLEGRKRWRYSRRPAVTGPTDNAFVDDAGTVRYNRRTPSSLRQWERIGPMDGTEVEEVVLEPGDVLCLPSGTWHEAKALEYSLALNLAFDPLPFTDLLAAALAEASRDLATWRLGLPPAPGAGDGPLPEPVRRSAHERVREAIEILTGFLDDDGALGDAWRRALDRPPPAVPPMTPVEAVGPEGATTATAPAGAGVDGFDGGLSCSLTVGEVASAVDWYRDVFGCRPVSVVPEFGWAELTTPVTGVRFGLAEVPTPGVEAGAVLNFGVDDIDAMRHRLEEQGVMFDGPTRTIVGMVRLAGFTDPFGNRLMIYQSLAGNPGGDGT